ncbi:hypothetical protein THRCLA_02317, partial [Thraustotheca clavata]
TYQGLLTLLKGRIQLELYYAGEMARLADAFKVENEDESTMFGALGSLKKQYHHISSQHKMLAVNLDEDIYQPLENLLKSLIKKEQQITTCTSRIRKQTKALEDHYRKQHSKMDKCFKEATTMYVQALESGISPLVIQHHYNTYLAENSLPSSPSFVVDGGNNAQEDPSFFTDLLTPRRRHTPRSPSTTLDSVKLVSWLLPNEQQKKDNLMVTAIKATEAADIARNECRQAYVGFEEARIALFRSMQSVLNDYQQIAENRFSAVANCLRKHVVFESASLANTQYDWQMVAKSMEGVDFNADIRTFILRQYRPAVAHMTIKDLCKVDHLPLPPLSTRFGLYDVTLRRYTMDKTGNTQSILGWLVTRDQSIHTKENASSTVPVVPSSVVAKAIQQTLACAIASISMPNIKPEEIMDLKKEQEDEVDSVHSESTQSIE